MARKLPRPLARREVLYGPVRFTTLPRAIPGRELVRLGHAYLEQDLVFDAADFFCEARDREGLEIVKARALESGDAFLLQQVRMAAPDLVSNSDWDELARRARELGKNIYADRASAGGATPPPPLQEEEKPEGAGEEDGAQAGGGGEGGQEAKGADARKVPGRGRKRR